MCQEPQGTDPVAIMMARYADPDGKLCVDYQYTLKQAVEDKSLRAPQIVLIDNQELSLIVKFAVNNVIHLSKHS